MCVSILPKNFKRWGPKPFILKFNNAWDQTISGKKKNAKKKYEKSLQVVLGLSEKYDEIPLNGKMRENIWYSFS